MAFKVVGGPADGLRVAAAAGLFRFIDPVRRRGFASPAPGRALYQRSGRSWLFCGMEAWCCRECGAVIRARTDGCKLCGMKRVREVADV